MVNASKMKTTEEDADVFEITDFTTQSEWERFIARLEEIIHEWKLTSLPPALPLGAGELASGEWVEDQDTLLFADFKFTITHHYLKQNIAKEASPTTEGREEAAEPAARIETSTDGEVVPALWLDLASTDNDFPSRAHCLVRWYGLRDFVVLAPAAPAESIDTESRANLLLSSISIALQNTACQVPIFIQVQQKWRRLYYGQYETTGFRTSFEMVHLKNIPPQYNHLAGLLDVFKAKLNCPVSPIPPVTVSVRLTYVLQDWPHYSWPQAPPDMDCPTGGEVGCTEFGDLPFGACEDPVYELHLSTMWPSLSEDMIVDNDVYSDLDPIQAPHWSVRVRMTEDPQCLLGDYLEEFVLLFRRRESTVQLLGNIVKEDGAAKDADISQALQRLTEPMPYTLPSIGTVVTKATSKLQIKPEEAPIAADVLNDILLFLFPDAAMEKEEADLKAASDAVQEVKGAFDKNAKQAEDEKKQQKNAKLKETFRQFKSAPPESLTHRLAVCMCIVNHGYGGLRAVAHLWQEFVLEMRYRWENNYLIPDLEPGSPNQGCSLVHQKLQMLNCCIRHKLLREELQASQPSAPEDPNTLGLPAKNPKLDASLDSSGSDDEFYECVDNSSQTSLKAAASGSENSSSPNSKQTVSASSGNSRKTKTEKEKANLKTSQLDSKTKQEKSLPADKSGDSQLGNEASPQTETDMELSQSETKKDEQSEVDKSDSTSASPSSESGDTLTQPVTMKKSQSHEPVASSSMTTPKRKASVIPSGSEAEQTASESGFLESLTHQPVGRLRQCNDYMLLNNEDKLYIPITQEPAPMTEDMLEEHAEVLAKLGTSSEGANLRARMQSACLMSDMEAFKAANPGCSLGDFVRWYSPRDWVDEEIVDESGNVTVKGQLSQRMQIPGNMWVEVWQSAKPVPVRRQKRLFDDTKEAEKVLHFLASMKPATVAQRLMPMLLHAAITKLLEQDESVIPVVQRSIVQLISKASKVMRAPRTDVQRLEMLVRTIGDIEVEITRAQSLRTKFSGNDKEAGHVLGNDVDEFITQLLEQPEVVVTDGSRGPIGSVIHNLFAAAQKSAYMLPEDEEDEAEASRQLAAISDFPPPTGKEYILRTTVPRPAPWSRPAPQRMFCVVIKDDFRLAGAFSNDTTFQ